MSRLYVTMLDVDRAELGPESSLPLLYEVNDDDDTMPSALPESDGLYIKYGFLKSAFPYRAQENYTRELSGKLQGVVLENEYLKASFAPSMGGKLWSLIDKTTGRDLLFSNPVCRPAYLATRNAWCSGGVEWNCGIFGHSPLTCSPLFAARLTGKNGAPILRMYEYERVRGVVYQMDFSLPAGSRVLICRMRVVNPSYNATAMYWWSNIAVPHVDGARVVVPADSAYTPVDGVMSVVPTPVRDGIDVTYPDNNPVSVDYFFRTDKKRRMYTCQLDKNGYGLFESSTSRLQGRKIFVWGQGPGGRKWQEYLSGNGSDGKYCEIQCGLAHTQSEHLPMPPMTAWEWIEIYGAMNADGEKVHGDWDSARAEVEARIGDIYTPEALEQLLIDTREDALTPAGEMLNMGAGWAALENMRRASVGLGAMCPHLDFGSVGQAQAKWIELLSTGSMGENPADVAPASWMRQREWTKLMEKAAEGADSENWYTLLQLGCVYLAQPDLLRADIYIGRSLAAKRTAWGVYAHAELVRVKGDANAAAALMAEAADLAPEDVSLARAAARMMKECAMWRELMAFTAARPEKVQAEPRMKMYLAFALAYSGDLDAAMAILEDEGRYLAVPDIKEGETSLSDLWYYIEERRAAADGRTFDRDKVAPPYALDFRMFAPGALPLDPA